MRRSVLAAVCVTALTLAACGTTTTRPTARRAGSGPSATTTGTPADHGGGRHRPGTTRPQPPAPPATTTAGADAAACAEGKTLEDGVLTFATSDPAFPPYVIDNAPETGEGFEAAVAMAVADQMGFTGDDVDVDPHHVRPGDPAGRQGLRPQHPAVLDHATKRERNVTFSAPYYTSNQALVGLDDSAAVGATTIADLKDLKLGAQTNTTSLEFITEVIQPDTEPSVYNDNVAVKAALDADQIDAVVFDLPTAFFVTAVEIEGSHGHRPVPARGRRPHRRLRHGAREGQPTRRVRRHGPRQRSSESGELDAITEQWMSD